MVAVKVSTFIVAGPDWLEDSDMASCESCGHWSSFDAGFEYNESGYLRGWYEDEISCFGGDSYQRWLNCEFLEYDNPDCEEGDCDEDCLCAVSRAPEDTVNRFREFLTEADTEEAKQILDELNRLGL